MIFSRLMRNMRISTRLYLGFGVVLALLLCVALLGIAGMAANQARLEGIVDGNAAKIRLASVMRDAVYDRMIALRNLALVNIPAEMQAEAARIAQQAGRYQKAQQELLALPGAGTATLMVAVARADRAAAPLIARARELAMTGQVDQMYTLLTQDLLPVQAGWMHALNALTVHEEDEGRKAMRLAGDAYGAAARVVAGLSLLAAVAGTFICVLLTRQLAQELGGEPRAAAAIAGRIASGDLASHGVAGNVPEGSLLHAVVLMRERLAAIVGDVRSGANSMGAGVGDIVATNLDLSSRTAQQARALESTKNVMARMTAAVQENVDHTSQASHAVREAAGATRRGSGALAQVVVTMETMSSSSKRIADIIGVIDGIAFQTNILALNAAVEAARAGEQGRGFAVVASEVRTLAQRSATAAMQIKQLIGTSQTTVEASNRIAGQAGAIMAEIQVGVESVERIMAGIAMASEKQHSTIVEVNQALEQMANVTSCNADLVAKAAARAQTLGVQAEELNRSVSQFREGADKPPSPQLAKAAPRSATALAGMPVP